MIRKLLSLTAACLTSMAVQAQSSMSITPGYCFNSVPGNTANVHPPFTSGITSYSYAVAGPGCTGSVIATTAGGTAATLQYQCCGMQTVTCFAYNGSSLIFTDAVMVNIACAPSLTMTSSSNFVLCGSGGQDTLSGFGAQSYTWQPGNFVGSTIGANPSSTTCYTLYGTNSQGCVGTSVRCITVNPYPAVNIQAPLMVCPLSPLTMTASGAISYTWIPAGGPGQNTSMYTINIMSGPCYTVYGTSNGCTSSATACVGTYSMPAISVAYDTTNFCLGSSITMTVGGATSYSWSNGATTHTLNVLPTSSTWYMVRGVDANGCKDSTYVNLIPNPNCAIVWPGDANSDGVVNSSDVVELGLYASSTGAPRNPGGNNYIGQYATAWTGSGSNSQNRAHVDCNGDGTVNSSDTLAIFNNFSMTHSFKSSGSRSLIGDLNLVPSTSAPVPGNWQQVDIVLGDSTNNIPNLYGVIFELSYDNTFVDNDQVHVRYPSSFLNTNDQNIPFRRMASGGGLINCVTVRTDGNTVSGNGKIGEFVFKHKASQLGIMNVSVSNVSVVDAAGKVTALSGGSGTLEFVIQGLKQHSTLSNAVRFYPNPVEDVLTITSLTRGTVAYTISDITGRSVAEGSFTNTTRLDISSFQAGCYIVTFEAEGEKVHRKLVIEK